MSILKYSVKWLLAKSCKKTVELCQRVPIIAPVEDHVQVAVKITGGLGDYIVLGRVLKDLQRYVGHLNYYIFVPNVKHAEWVFKEVPGVKGYYPEMFFDKCKVDCDCALHLNNFVFFDEQNINISKLKKISPVLLDVIAKTVISRQPWNLFIENHPVLDGAFARQAVALGYNRYNFVHSCLGIPNSGNLFELQIALDEVKKVSSKFKKYITINTGFDHQFIISSKYATKCYPNEYWEELVQLIKDGLPGIGVIQIGGKNSACIKGCDIHCEGKLSLAQSAGILKSSLLHVDIEGGLVHVCAALGTKCLVFFGPTSKKYFAYDENINLQSGECSDCWWASERWMERCPHRYPVAQCMYQLQPEKAYSAIALYLKHQGISHERKS